MLDAAVQAAKALALVWFSQHPYYQPHHQAAIFKRIELESHFNPNADNGAGCICLLQWLGQRAHGVSQGTGRCPSVTAQLDYMDHEFRSNHRFYAFFRTTPSTAYPFIRDVYAGGRDAHHTHVARRHSHLASR